MAIERAKSETIARGVGAAIKSKPLHAPKGQDDFEAEARQLADQIGWAEDHAVASKDVVFVKNEIRVADAVGYLRKILHERHVAAHNPSVVATSAETACDHLGLASEPEAVALLTSTLAEIYERECASVQG